jgi:hypothetical protein
MVIQNLQIWNESKRTSMCVEKDRDYVGLKQCSTSS